MGVLATSTAVPVFPGLEARAVLENFPVAPWFLPPATRRHLAAIYGFARLVDTIGDEADGDRAALLDALETELDRAYSGRALHPTLRRLQATIRELALPRGPFADLIEANRRDQRVGRYETFEDLLDYCRLSAEPVGRLVLHVFGVATPERCPLSDTICAALQIIEHCQDVGEDFERGRVYLPRADMERFGCSDTDLRTVPAPIPLRRVVALQLQRAAALLDRGAPLLGTLRGRAWLCVLGFVAGGWAAADALCRARFDPLSSPSPRPCKWDFARRAVRLALAHPPAWRSG